MMTTIPKPTPMSPLQQKQRQQDHNTTKNSVRRLFGSLEHAAAFFGFGLLLVLAITLVIHTRVSRNDFSSTTFAPTGYLRDNIALYNHHHENNNNNHNNNNNFRETHSRWFWNPKTKSKQKRHSSWQTSSIPTMVLPFEILFQEPLSTTPSIHSPAPLGLLELHEAGYMDFGSLQNSLLLLEEEGDHRLIYRNPNDLQNNFRESFVPADDDQDAYYAFDDDHLRSARGTIAHVELTDKLCRRTADHRLNFQTCNTFHETPFLDNNAEPLGSGAFRQVFGLWRSFGQNEEQIVIKDIKFDRDINFHDFEYTRVDANIAERLTSSPRIYDIYGHCGIGILSEWFPHGDMEEASIDYENLPDVADIHKTMQASDTVVVYNSLLPRDKLRAALHMSEAVAELHGYAHGVIVHQDIQLSQFLLNEDMTRIKLNDFNRAEFMLWDDEAQEYCKYSPGIARGNWRSPEEYSEINHNEQIDVFSLGNNFYSMLTGLEPFWEEGDDYDKVQERVRAGDKATIDPRFHNRTLEESKLVEIIDRCFEFDPEKRPSIFEVVKFLRDAMDQVDKAKPPIQASTAD
ncbi:PAS domain containing protein [Nitzschia inconspicua]|uniref:PAS domain containing protein n=1 Tax=Nitzschia inconspicua TaxID=303405 RepID=A0A9K3KDT1_9STRA|nr:PAS domain containing protein [Nitzschia inconspicua]